MCYIQTLRGITGNSDTTNTNPPWGTMPWPCPRRSVVKQSGQVSRSRRSKQNVRWRDELRHQPGPGGPISQPRKWDQHPKARKTGPMPHCVYRWILYRKCRDYTSCSRQVLTWRGGGTREREPSHSPRLVSPLHKNLPGGPKVSRGTRNTIKIIKIKIYTRLQENHNKKGVYPITPPTAGWAGPTTSFRKGARALWKRRPGADSASSSPGANQEEVRANLS